MCRQVEKARLTQMLAVGSASLEKLSSWDLLSGFGAKNGSQPRFYPVVQGASYHEWCTAHSKFPNSKDHLGMVRAYHMVPVVNLVGQ